MADSSLYMKKPTFLITAGPTREYLDPVRFLSNASSGRMGYALAAAARKMGYPVVLISGPAEVEPPKGVTFVPVTSAAEMFAAVRARFDGSDIVIGAAAVADYRPARQQKQKIKKRGGSRTLRLVRNPDIIAWAGRRKGRKAVAGFALESHKLIPNALRKLKEKDLDLIVANAPEAIGAGRSSAWIIGVGRAVPVRNAGKDILAGKILNETIGIWKNRQAR